MGGPRREARAILDNETLESQAERCVRRLVEGLRPALSKPRHALLSEDYMIFTVNRLNRAHDADELVRMHGDAIAALLRGEGTALSSQERDEVLRHRISYLADDLDRWKTNVKEKLRTLDDIYRFSVEQVGMSRGQFLELTIVLILVLELVLFFAGLME